MKKNGTIRLLVFLSVMWCGFKIWEAGGSDRYIFDINRKKPEQQTSVTVGTEKVTQKKSKVVPAPKDDSKEKIIWGDKGGSDFITELRPENPMEGVITDEDSDWINVAGMKHILWGNAALIKESNRYWIGKEVLISGDEDKAFSCKMQEQLDWYEENREEWAADNGYISCVDDRAGTLYLPYTVNSFATENKNGEYITPEVIFGNKAMVVYTKPDGSGWKLKEGQSLAFEAEQYKLDKEKVPGKGQKILYGYICDGKLYEDTEDSGILHQYKLTADTDGEYFITIMGDQSMVTLKNGCIKAS